MTARDVECSRSGQKARDVFGASSTSGDQNGLLVRFTDTKSLYNNSFILFYWYSMTLRVWV
jgi:hypothetical protein